MVMIIISIMSQLKRAYFKGKRWTNGPFLKSSTDKRRSLIKAQLYSAWFLTALAWLNKGRYRRYLA